MWREQFDEVITLGTEALDLLPEGTRPWCRAFRFVCGVAINIGRPALIDALARRFDHVEPSGDARGEYVQGTTWVAMTLAITGMKDQSRAFRERARRAGAVTGRGDLLTWGYVAVMDALDGLLIEELPWSAMTRFVEGTDALRSVGEQRYQLTLRAFSGRNLHDLGDLTGAEAALRASLAEALGLGDALPPTYARAYLARLLAQTNPTDRLDEPEALARDVIAAKNFSLMGDAHAALAEIRRRRGDLVEAEREARAACEAVRPFPSYGWGIVALHARILLGQGRVEEAALVAEAGVEQMQRLGIEGNGEIDLRLAQAEARCARGSREAAHAALAETLPRLRRRLDDIPEPPARERYLTNVPANARAIALARAWLGEAAARAIRA